MSKASYSRNEINIWDQSTIITGVTERLIKKRRQTEYITPKITHNNPEVINRTINHTFNSFDESDEGFKRTSYLKNTIDRRLKENFNFGKYTVQEEVFMEPCKWTLFNYRSCLCRNSWNSFCQFHLGFVYCLIFLNLLKFLLFFSVKND